ncbi:MAG: hypothetical protein ACXACY_13040 [Candidatus Hodarchaeales archaeon]|jgi:hypothetical protein
MIKDEIFEAIEKLLLESGGLILQPVDKWEYDTILPYIKYIYRYIDDTPVTFQENLERHINLLIVLLELRRYDEMISQIKDYKFFHDLYYDTKPIENLSSFLIDVHNNYNNIGFMLSKFITSVYQKCCNLLKKESTDVDELINELIIAGIEERNSKYFVNISSVHWFMATDYMKRLELEPTTENAMKYLVYKTVEMENTMPAVYYGTVEKVFGFTPIINMQNKLNDIVHTYQIRPFTKNKRKLYNLFYVELKSNTVEQINGPLTKKSGICYL